MARDRFDDGMPFFFKVWFAFCALLGIAMVGGLVWLIVAAVGWLGRH